MSKRSSLFTAFLALVILAFLSLAVFLGRPLALKMTEPEKVAIQIDTSKLDFSGITKKMESIERVTKTISNPLRISWGKRV